MVVATCRRKPQTLPRTIQYDIRNMRHDRTSSTGGGILPEAAVSVLIWINGPGLDADALYRPSKNCRFLDLPQNPPPTAGLQDESRRHSEEAMTYKTVMAGLAL